MSSGPASRANELDRNDAETRAPVADGGVQDVGALGEVVCRLFAGCDGGPDCAVNRPCASCFASASGARARAECEDLYLRNACLDLCRRNYSACERECRRLYESPAEWPAP